MKVFETLLEEKDHRSIGKQYFLLLNPLSEFHCCQNDEQWSEIWPKSWRIVILVPRNQVCGYCQTVSGVDHREACRSGCPPMGHT